MKSYEETMETAAYYYAAAYGEHANDSDKSEWIAVKEIIAVIYGKSNADVSRDARAIASREGIGW